MSDVDWLSIEQIEAEFFATRAELIVLEEAGDLDTKIVENDAKNQRLFMRHQIIRQFDARDSIVKLPSKDVIDVAKDVFGEGLKYSLAAGFGALAVQLRAEKSDDNLVDAYTELLATYDPREIEELARRQ